MSSDLIASKHKKPNYLMTETGTEGELYPESIGV